MSLLYLLHLLDNMQIVAVSCQCVFVVVVVVVIVVVSLQNWVSPPAQSWCDPDTTHGKERCPWQPMRIRTNTIHDQNPLQNESKSHQKRKGKSSTQKYLWELIYFFSHSEVQIWLKMIDFHSLPIIINHWRFIASKCGWLSSKKVTTHPGAHPRQSPYSTMKGFPLSTTYC